MDLSRKTILMLIFAIVTTIGAITVRNRLSQAPAQAQAPQARVLVAKHDLTVGTFVQGVQDLDWAPAPQDAVQRPHAPEAGGTGDNAPAPAPAHENYLFEGAVKLTDFNGAVVRRSVHMGEPVPQTALMKSGEGGFMSAVLTPGTRAVSIAVNATSGNAGFVSPGDHVDLIVSHRVKTTQSGGVADEVIMSETFSHDVRVVAVDQMLDNPDNKAILAKTVTVEVTPRQAEEVATAAEMGKISIALRSLPPAENKTEVKDETAAAPAADAAPADAAAKKDANDTAHVLGDLYDAQARDADPGQMSGHKSSLVPRVMVIRGDKSENVDFYQGKQ